MISQVKKARLEAPDLYRLVSRIPPGRVTTYGILARALGCPGAGRAVGALLRRNPCPERVPCHRVIRADGRPGGYFGGSPGGAERKAAMLAAEGVDLFSGDFPPPLGADFFRGPEGAE